MQALVRRVSVGFAVGVVGRALTGGKHGDGIIVGETFDIRGGQTAGVEGVLLIGDLYTGNGVVAVEIQNTDGGGAGNNRRP